MQGIIGKTLLGLSLAGIALGAQALDTSKPILCATTQVYQCVDGIGCESVLPESVGAPTFIRVNLKKKQLRVSKEGNPTKIKHTEEVENRLIMTGAEDGDAERSDGSGWIMSIEHDTARFAASVVVSQASLNLFGACTEPLDF
jgi:hypothetical protein